MSSTRDRRTRHATFVVFAVQGLSFATLLTQVAHLQDKHELSTGTLTVLLLIVPIFAGVGSAIATLGFLGIVTAPGRPLAIVAFGLTGMGLAVVAPQSFSAAGRLDPAGTGVVIAWVNLFNYIGFIVGSGLVGVLADIGDMRLAFVVPLVLVAAIVALARGFEPALRTRT